jgi:hypothetical protein
VAAADGGGPETACAQAAGPMASSTTNSNPTKVAGCGKRFRRRAGIGPIFPDGLGPKPLNTHERGQITTTHQHSGLHREAGIDPNGYSRECEAYDSGGNCAVCETLERRGLACKGDEHRVQLSDTQQIYNACRRVHQLELAAVLIHAGVCAGQFS